MLGGCPPCRGQVQKGFNVIAEGCWFESSSGSQSFMEMTDQYFVYVLRNPEKRIYIGYTIDLKRRVCEHQEGKGGWTRDRGPWELVYYETFDDRKEAMRRERNLKRGKANQELRVLVAKTASIAMLSRPKD
jgi:putative endonuclease